MYMLCEFSSVFEGLTLDIAEIRQLSSIKQYLFIKIRLFDKQISSYFGSFYPCVIRLRLTIVFLN